MDAVAEQQLPWRGPGPDRPDLPLPPGSMPLWRRGQLRKRWRYVACFAEELMLCAARVQVGPFRQLFWVLWDRETRSRLAGTSVRPWSGAVAMEGGRVAVTARGLEARLELGSAEAVEAICPSGSAWGWTRKRAGMPVAVTIDLDGRRRRIEGLGVDDESAGYHRRETSWHWSAGVGRDAKGRGLAWNLVEGINDPPRNSERAIWIDGEPSEPPPASFQGLEAIDLGAGRLEFRSETERARTDNLVLLRSSYRMRFGAFSGSLGGAPLAEGLGVMESHEARW